MVRQFFIILNESIQFNTEVQNVHQNKHGKWDVTVKSSNKSQVSEFDFVVVCNGIYNEPNRPAWEGIEKFTGDVIHTTEVNRSFMFLTDRHPENRTKEKELQ